MGLLKLLILLRFGLFLAALATLATVLVVDLLNAIGSSLPDIAVGFAVKCVGSV